MRKKMKKLMMLICMVVSLLACTACDPVSLGRKTAEMIYGTEDENDNTTDYADDEMDDYDVEEDYEFDESDDDVEEEDDYEFNDEDYEGDYVDSSDNLVVPESVITDYNWKAYHDGSLIVCETDSTFRYYQSEEDMTDDYFEGTYEFYVGAEAVEYVTTVLSEFDVTEEELEGLFERSEEHDESNFVCLVLHNETCIVDGENTIEEPYDRPYYGSCIMVDGAWTLNIVNMNTANQHCFTAQ